MALYVLEQWSSPAAWCFAGGCWPAQGPTRKGAFSALEGGGSSCSIPGAGALPGQQPRTTGQCRTLHPSLFTYNHSCPVTQLLSISG